MSKIENPKKVLKITLENQVLNHNALIHRKNKAKNVTIKFYIFLNKFKNFFIMEIYGKRGNKIIQKKRERIFM
jgi:hypothetical protein